MEYVCNCKYEEAVRLYTLFMHVYESGNINGTYLNVCDVSDICWPCSMNWKSLFFNSPAQLLVCTVINL